MATTEMQPNSAADLFDSIGQPYQVAFKNLPAQDKALQWLLTQLPPSSKTLDIGSGTGRPTAEVLSSAGHSVTGVDISAEMVRVARAQVPAANFVHADVRTWQKGSPAPASLDAVTAFLSLIADVSQDDIKRVLLRVAGWLKPGGIFVLATAAEHPGSIAVKWMGRNLTGEGFSAEESVKHVRAAGLEVTDVEKANFWPKGSEAGLCQPEEVWEEHHVWIYARKPA